MTDKEKKEDYELIIEMLRRYAMFEEIPALKEQAKKYAETINATDFYPVYSGVLQAKYEGLKQEVKYFLEKYEKIKNGNPI